MNDGRRIAIQRLYEALYPYSGYHNDIHRACKEIRSEINNLSQDNKNLPLLLVLARSADIKVSPNDNHHSLKVKILQVTEQQCIEEKSLYERLGGVYAIAAVVNRFSDQLILNPITGIGSPNKQLDEWSRTKLASRLPGLKFMRTLWVCDISGGPYKFQRSQANPVGLSSVDNSNSLATTEKLNLSKPHCPFRIEPEIFDEVAKELELSLNFFQVPPREKSETLAAFAAHKNEVTSCFFR